MTYSAKQSSQKLGRFELSQVVGSGAFGTVYKAFDPQLHRVVAVKVPRSGALTGPAEFERFLREARSVAQLQHPGIVPIHEVNQHDGTPYLVSDFIEGVTLADLLTARRPELRDAAELVADLAETLDYAHRRGVIHRDVKPSNIMMQHQGGNSPARPMLMDFGLAKRDAGDVTMTVSGEVLGTPAYMSPEQARGDSRGVDGRTDVYSLGVILYQLLTGELPFRGNTRMLLHQVLHDDPRSLRSFNDKVPRDLETICLRAMAKEPVRRYRSASELAADLRRFLGGEPIHARPITTLERVVRWCGRNRAVASLTAGIALSLLLGAVTACVLALVAMSNADRQRMARTEADKNAAIARDNETKAKKHAAETRAALEHFEIANGLRLADSGDLAGGLLWFTAPLMRPDGANHDTHRERITSYWRNTPKPTLVHMFFHQAPIRLVDFSPDGRRFVTASSDATARVWDVATGQAVGPALGHPRQVTAARFLPDGKRILTHGNDGRYRLWDTRDWTVTRVFENAATPGFANPISPEGSRLVSIDGKAAVLRDIETGEAIGLPLEHREFITYATFSPDGKTVATASNDRTARLWNARTGEPIGQPMRHDYSIQVLAFSPDGRWLITCSQDRTARLWSTSDYRPATKPLVHRQAVLFASFSPDSQRVVTGCDDGTAQSWDVRSGTKIGAPIRHRGPVWHVLFSPDGRRILTSSRDNTARLWDAGTSQPLSPPLAHGGETRFLAFHPDSRRFATSSADGTARIWDAATCLPPAPIRQLGDVHAASPNGQFLATVDGGGVARVRESLTGLIQGVPVVLGGAPKHVEISDDGVHLAAQMEGVPVHAANMRTGRTFDLPGAEFIMSTDLNYPSLSQNRAWLATRSRNASAEDQIIRRVQTWDLARGRLVSEGQPTTSAIYSVAFTPDGGHLVAHSAEHGLIAWDIGAARRVHTFHHGDIVHSTNFSADGKLAVTASEDWTARVWNYATGEPVGPPLRHQGPVRRCLFHPDGHHVATLMIDGTARVWDPISARVVRPPILFPGREYWRVAFTRNGRQLITAGDDFVRFWDLATGHAISPPLAVSKRISVATLITDERLLTLSADRTARLWDVSLQMLTLDECQRLAPFYHGNRLDSFGGLEPLRVKPSPAEPFMHSEQLIETWRFLKTRLEHDFAVTQKQAIAWHERELAASLADRDLPAVLFHARSMGRTWPLVVMPVF